ncbi:hypothetical protein CsSME_00036393 [Camellia sinensis var. sinensis]
MICSTDIMEKLRRVGARTLGPGRLGKMLLEED